MRIAIGLLAAATAAALFWAAGDAGARPGTFRTSAGIVAVERVAGPFEHPWGFGFLPDGSVLVTERGGRLWRLDAAGGRVGVAGLPDSIEDGQGGLMDVVPARDFAATRELFLTYAAPEGRRTRTTLARARLGETGDRLEAVTVLVRQDPAVDSGRHFGSRVVEAPDGTLFVTVGDRGEPPFAQDGGTTIGKVLRVARDGSVPPDNPFAARPGMRGEIWSLGHRNPQGAALDADGRLWTVEHGARGGDEVNRPEAGRNYGWPRISYGTQYSGLPHPGTAAPGLEQPVFHWDPSIAPSGMAIYSGRLWPAWAGDIFVGALKAGLVARLDREGDRIAGEERLFAGEFGRVRDIREAPDGTLWFLTDAGDGALWRVRPAD